MSDNSRLPVPVLRVGTSNLLKEIITFNDIL